MTPRFSIVIPTHDRLAILREVVAAIESQVRAPPFELIVVDDGSSDGTGEWLTAHDFRIPARTLVQANQGPAAARNAGVAAAGGEYVAFLGDDTVPAPDWLAEHARAHDAYEGVGELAVVGHIDWHPRMRATRFLRYINDYGLQFGFAIIDDPEDVPYFFFYTSNVSLRRSLLVAEPFDTQFPYAAWEDVELGGRLTAHNGLRLIYRAAARVWHDHPTDFSRFAERQERVGYAAVRFFAKRPDLGAMLGMSPHGPAPAPRLYGLGRLVRWLEPLDLYLPLLWKPVLRQHYIRGLHRGWVAAQSAS